MSDKQVVETIYGKYSKFEIMKSPGGLISNTSFSIYKDGQYWKGSYDSFARAVEVARAAG
ncbi:hypothetical protein [Pararhodobacter sp. SW119]|uniref:hypothetical protein n=1 Tax=Pararhodobacter sp. SW119 TaxID=2780075 RepID=UPI001AE00936|nr:hypothetical protein [Pararhodobacter sp. SW119]